MNADRGPDVEQKGDNEYACDDQFFQEAFARRGDGFMNEVAPIVDCEDFHALRQGWFGLFELRFHALDHIDGVLAEPHNHDPARDLALAVELDQSSPHVGTEPHRRHVAQQNRRAVLVDPDGDLFDIVGLLNVAAPADDIFDPGELHDAPTDIVIALAYRFDDGREGEAIGRHLRRV